MGNSTSMPRQHGGRKLYKMMKYQPSYEDTINFKRQDLQDTLSSRSIVDIIHKGGVRVNAPNRDRYSSLETQKTKNDSPNMIGGNVSENDLSAIKNLIMMGGGCGCGENTVIKQNGGANSITSTFAPQTLNLSATSASFNMSDSAMNRLVKVAHLQFGGEDDIDVEPKYNTTSELINALSLSNSNRQPMNYSNINGGQKGGNEEEIKDDEKKDDDKKKENKENNDIDEIDGSPSESTTTEESPESTLKRIETADKVRSNKASSTSSSDSSSVIGSMSSSTTVNSTSSTASSSKSSPYGATIKSVSGGNNIYIATESMNNNNFIDAKQFYSSDAGELYSSDTNYLKNNIHKRRFAP